MNTDNNRPEKTGLSVLPFDPTDLSKIRVSQAGLAKLMGVSRQSVNGWIKGGKISVFPDGTIDPETAVREYIANTGGGSLRAKLLQPVTAEMDQLREINHDLAEKLAKTAEQLQQAKTGLETIHAESLEYSTWLYEFYDLLVGRLSDLRGAVDEEASKYLLDELFEAASVFAMEKTT